MEADKSLPPGGLLRKRVPHHARATNQDNNTRIDNPHAGSNKGKHAVDKDNGQGQEIFPWTSSCQDEPSLRIKRLTPVPVVAAFEAGERYCEACLEARSAEDFGKRVKSLLHKRLRCSACNVAHTAIRFSASQRLADRNTAKNRICIVHEGVVRLCSHRAISRAELVALGSQCKWSDSEPRYADCEHAEHQTNFQPRERLGHVRQLGRPTITADYPHLSLLASYITYTMRPILSSSVQESLDACNRAILKALPECNGFCPHFKTNPDRIFRPESWESKSTKHVDLVCKCLHCETKIRITFGGPSTPGREERAPVFVQVEVLFMKKSDGIFFQDLNNHIDPESYGHFSDAETKNITWCDDKTCATTFELGAHAAAQSWGNLNVTSKAVYDKLSLKCIADGSIVASLTPTVHNPASKRTAAWKGR